MDLQILTNLFASTFDPNPNVQKVAELEIRKVSFVIVVASRAAVNQLIIGQWSGGHDSGPAANYCLR